VGDAFSALWPLETDPARLKDLGDRRLRATDSELIDALSGQVEPLHRKVLTLYLQRLDVIEAQMAKIEELIFGSNESV
jgi:hypothetical protein